MQAYTLLSNPTQENIKQAKINIDNVLISLSNTQDLDNQRSKELDYDAQLNDILNEGY